MTTTTEQTALVATNPDEAFRAAVGEDVLARLAEATPRVSDPTVFQGRIARSRNRAVRKGRTLARKAAQGLLGRTPGETMNPGAANALALRLAREATEARLAMLDAAAGVLEDDALVVAGASAREQGRALRVATRDRTLDEDEREVLREEVALRLNGARREAAKLRTKLAQRLARALRSTDPRAEVAAVIRSPLDPTRVVTQPTWDVLVIARDAGTQAAGRRAGVTSYRFVATLDHRTTPLCRAAHGRSVSTDDAREGPGSFLDARRPPPRGARLVPPLHFRCRSRLVPVRGQR